MATLILLTILAYLLGCDFVDRRVASKPKPHRLQQYFMNIKSGDSCWLI